MRMSALLFAGLFALCMSPAMAAEAARSPRSAEAEPLTVARASDRVYSITLRMEQGESAVADTELLVTEGRTASVTVADDAVTGGSYRIGVTAQRATVPGQSDAAEGIAIDMQIFRGDGGRWVLVSEPGFVVRAGSAATLAIDGGADTGVGVDQGLRLAVTALALRPDEAIAECARFRGNDAAGAIAGSRPDSGCLVADRGRPTP